jgi:hypothetical protein
MPGQVGHVHSDGRRRHTIEGMVLTNNKSACDRVAMEHVAECGWTAENPGSGQGLAMASIGGRMRGTQP